MDRNKKRKPERALWKINKNLFFFIVYFDEANNLISFDYLH